MHRVAQISSLSVAAAIVLISGTSSLLAAGPHRLTDRQLDGVTAGGAAAASSTDAAAAGVIAITATTGNSAVNPGISPYAGQPDLSASVGVSDGTALAVGTNLGQSNQPPASASTSVVTAGIADGTQVFSSTINQTVQGAGGVQFQLGWTFVYGGWRGL